MHDQSLQEMYRHRTFLRGMYGRNPGAMRPDPSAPIALPPRQVTPRMPQPGRPMPAPMPQMPQPGGQQRSRPIQASMEYLSYGGPAAAGFGAFLQKYPLVGRLFGR